jgi:hypothetical protein
MVGQSEVEPMMMAMGGCVAAMMRTFISRLGKRHLLSQAAQKTNKDFCVLKKAPSLSESSVLDAFNLFAKLRENLRWCFSVS